MSELDPLAAPLQAALAAELRDIRGLLERLEMVLVGDAHFAANYLHELQAFDLVAQHVDEIARVLDRLSSRMTAHAAIEPVRLGAVQDGLRRALAQAG